VTDMCLDSGVTSSELKTASLYRIDPSRRDAMVERYQAVRDGCHACLQLAGTCCSSLSNIGMLNLVFP